MTPIGPMPAAEPLLLTIAAAAHALSLSRRSVERLIAHGHLTSRVIGSRRLITRASVEQLARRNTPHIAEEVR